MNHSEEYEYDTKLKNLPKGVFWTELTLNNMSLNPVIASFDLELLEEFASKGFEHNDRVNLWVRESGKVSVERKVEVKVQKKVETKTPTKASIKTPFTNPNKNLESTLESLPESRSNK